MDRRGSYGKANPAICPVGGQYGWIQRFRFIIWFETDNEWTKGEIVADENGAHKWIMMLGKDRVIFSQDCILEQENNTLRCLWCQTMADAGRNLWICFPLRRRFGLKLEYKLYFKFYLVDLEKWHHSVPSDDLLNNSRLDLGDFCLVLLVCFGYVCNIGSFLALRESLFLNWDGHIVLLCLVANTLYRCEPAGHHVKVIKGVASCCLHSISESAFPFDYTRCECGWKHSRKQDSVQESEHLCDAVAMSHWFPWNLENVCRAAQWNLEAWASENLFPGGWDVVTPHTRWNSVFWVEASSDHLA